MTWIRRNLARILVTVGCACTLMAVIFVQEKTLATGGTVVGVVIAMTSLFVEASSKPSLLDTEREQLALERRDFADWQTAQTQLFEEQAERIEERNRDLLERSAIFQEFAEYPQEHTVAPDGIAKLSESDRRVNQILESEAERVYEKIRSNGYTIDGNVNVDQIRDEVFDLVQRVAAVYAPDSDNPILETSFEQLARSVSRICLHTLVLLEQLPLDVQKYNINELHSYVRTAVVGYGTYQKVAPWMKYLSRGAYIGRIAAGANPVTLGAWWIATELGQRGAKKFVDNVVDRQAIGVLHDLITVVGTEIANVYGPGYRQRDAGWVYGTELVDLLSRFPVSRESLSHALREITATRLRSEYDRIYLYRCIANHHSAVARISDSTLISRDEREGVARKLEAFYRSHVHGKTAELEDAWRADVESRLDLRLKLDEGAVESSADWAAASVRSIRGFLVSVMGVDPETAANTIGSTDLMTSVALEERASLLKPFAAESSAPGFAPPDLDPTAEHTTFFLSTLFSCFARHSNDDAHIEELLIETSCYFRRSREESLELLNRHFIEEATRRFPDGTRIPTLSSGLARAVVRETSRQEELIAIYCDVELPDSTETTTAPAVLILKSPTIEKSLAVLVDGLSSQTLWRSDTDTVAERSKGVFVDDCVLNGGEWTEESAAGSRIVLSGSMRRGTYQTHFAPILSMASAAQ